MKSSWIIMPSKGSGGHAYRTGKRASQWGGHFSGKTTHSQVKPQTPHRHLYDGIAVSLGLL